MSEKKVDTTRLQRIARAYTESAVLFSALDLELFTHVSNGHDTEAKLADAMQITALNVDRLVTACLAMGLLQLDGERLRNAPDAQRFLVKGQRGYSGPWMFFTRPTVIEWFRLTDYLRCQNPPSKLGMYQELTVAEARAYHAATYSIGMGAGRRFCTHVDLSKRTKLLDLGGGSGAYSINAVKTYPNLKAVVLDLPPVVEVTQEYLRANGVADRVSTLAADFTTAPFPDDVDVIVMASNLPIYNEEMIQLVIQKAYDALLPGGEMHLIGEMLYNDRSGPLDAAMWGMHEAICGSAGKAHTIAQGMQYFRHAGFIDVTEQVFVPGVLHRVSGRKA